MPPVHANSPLALIAGASLLLSAGPAPAQPSSHTIASQARAAAAPEFADRTDFEFAERGFLGSRSDPVIRAADGAAAWDLSAYDFLKGERPASVEPALWRQSQLLAKHGLFQVQDGIYQVRGFDLANVTFIRGQTGWIVIDPLGSAETAKAAYDLVTEKLGARPITAVIYTHSHTDHFGGAGGVVTPAEAASGKVKVIAPEGFMAAVASENITAGPAMSRRATYQFGVFLPRGVEGQVSAGIGPGLSRGAAGLIAPNVTVTEAASRLTVDGVRMEFQLTPETEAPAEMNIYLPDFRALCMAENANATMHNILTPRGALVRDTKVWADQLTRSLRLYGDKSDVMFTSHAWPRFGRTAVTDFLAKHRDAYKFLHDQTVRLMNGGATGPEIAAQLKLPPVLAREWYNHGFYGTVSFNSRAVYQRYMGWYDGNPVHLAAAPPVDMAKRYVDAMGGREAVRAMVQKAHEAGDYAWAAELGDKLVFSDPADAAAKTQLAATYAQLGFQAESSLWRNIYLTGADELKSGIKGRPNQAGALLAGASLPLMLDAMAVRLDPTKAGDQRLAMQIVLTDAPDKAYVTVANGVLVHEPIAAPRAVEVTLTLPRLALAQILGGGPPALDAGLAGGAVKAEGDVAAIKRWLGWMDGPAAPFPIVTP